MQGYTRRQLKEDRFAETAKDAADWASGHRRSVLWAIAIVVLVAAAVGGYFAWQSRQSEQANIALSAAMRTFSDPLRPAGTPAPAGEDASYTSSVDRAKAAAKQFQPIADNYSMTKAGKIARYM